MWRRGVWGVGLVCVLCGAAATFVVVGVTPGVTSDVSTPHRPHDDATQRYLNEMESQGWDTEGHEEAHRKSTPRQ